MGRDTTNNRLGLGVAPEHDLDRGMILYLLLRFLLTAKNKTWKFSAEYALYRVLSSLQIR